MPLHARVDLAALKAAHPLIEIVEQTVQLQRIGLNYRGLCPFHAERTPSFYLYPDSDTGGSWYCFSGRCCRGGDVFEFLRLRDGVSFPEAVAYLRNRLPDPSTPNRVRQEQRKRTKVTDQLRALQMVVDLYARRLWQTGGYPGRRYLQQRGISETTARAYKLGFCSGNDLASLTDELWRQRVPLQAAKDIGVLVGKAGQERFAQRVIIPEIRGGQACWMTGRHVQDVPDKYLNVNGPRHILGADTVYGAAEVIGDEGPFNWLTLCQWNLPAFSFTGGSLPAEAYQWLREAKRIYLPFHRDKPGWSATCRLAPKLDGRAQIVNLPQRWHDHFLNDVNDLACLSPNPFDGYSLFLQCGRAALPWRDEYINLDYHDLPIVVLPT